MSAMSHGRWQVNACLARHAAMVREQPNYQAVRIGRYTCQVIDMVGFFRPKLQGCKTKHYNGGVGKAIPAIEFGMIAEVGVIENKRTSVLTQVVRMPAKEVKHVKLRQALIVAATKAAGPTTLVLADAEFSAAELLAENAGCSFVIRAAKNCTFERAATHQFKSSGNYKRGDIVRPLERTHNKKVKPATPADQCEIVTHPDGTSVTVKLWFNARLPRSMIKRVAGADTDLAKCLHEAPVTVAAIHHPAFHGPLVVVTNARDLTAQELTPAYPQRWPIEVVPLAAKQLFGGARQFVHNPEHCQRLPELYLLTGNMMTCAAAFNPASSTGFWDPKPQPTAGRLRPQISRLAATPSFAATLKNWEKAPSRTPLTRPKQLQRHRIPAQLKC